MKVLLTGASGFVGSAFTQYLAARGKEVIAVSRSLPLVEAQSSLVQYAQKDITSDENWKPIFEGVSHVVHAAARVHVMKESSSDPLSEFRRVNTNGTLNLARQAAVSGVKRFLFLSTIGVNGSTTSGNRQNEYRFTEDSGVSPHSPYAMSKWEAEKGLREIAQRTGMEVVIIRPPLIYGQNAPGNYRTLIKWLSKGIPLPLARINNKRSLIGIDNLMDFMNLALQHQGAANETFLISDGEDISMTALAESLCTALNVPSRFFPLPKTLVELMARLANKEKVLEQIYGSLQVDINKSIKLLGWRPRVTLQEGIERSVVGISR